MPHESFLGSTVIRTFFATIGPKALRWLARFDGTGQVIQELRSLRELPTGEAFHQAVREWADRLKPAWRSAINPMLEDFFRADLSEDDVNNKGKRREGQSDSHAATDKAAGNHAPIAQGYSRVYSLADPYKTQILSALHKIEDFKIRNVVIAKLSTFTPQGLMGLAEEITRQSDKADLIEMLGLKGDPEASSSKKSHTSDDDRATAFRLLDKLAATDLAAFNAILDVTCDTAFDSDEDEQRYFSTLARMWGDGTETTVAHSTRILQEVAKRQLAARRHFFGVRVHLGRQVGGWLAGKITSSSGNTITADDLEKARETTRAMRLARHTRWELRRQRREQSTQSSQQVAATA